MTEPEPRESEKSRLFTRKRLIEFVVSVIVAGSIGFLLDLAWPAEEGNELTSLRASAYATIAEFAPWNVGYRYAQIVFTEGNADAAQFAEQQQRQTEAFRSFACRIGGVSGSGDPCTP